MPLASGTSRPQQEILCWTIMGRGAQSGIYITPALNGVFCMLYIFTSTMHGLDS